MAADLKLRNLFSSNSIVLLDDHLVELEHGHTSDRVRRVLYDRIESVIHWRVQPLGRMIAFGLVFGIPGMLAIMSSDSVWGTMGVILLAITVILEARYLYTGKASVRILRAGRTFEINGIVSPRKLRRLLDRLRLDIERVQQQAASVSTDHAVQSRIPVELMPNEGTDRGNTTLT